LADGDAYADGAWAPPGRYTIALTVDGQTWTQPLTVVPDPRVHLPAAAYAQQFAFARQVEAAQARLAPAEAEAKRLHAALRTTRAAAGPPWAERLDALDRKVAELAGLNDPPNPNNGMPPTRTTSFAFLSQALGKLANAADDADTAPSPDARRGYDALVPMLARALTSWTQLEASDVAPLNDALRSAGKPELEYGAEATKSAP